MKRIFNNLKNWLIILFVKVHILDYYKYINLFHPNIKVIMQDITVIPNSLDNSTIMSVPIANKGFIKEPILIKSKEDFDKIFKEIGGK
jgi:hypothetical protein